MRTIGVEVRHNNKILKIIVRKPLYCENRSIGIPYYKAWYKGNHYRIFGNVTRDIRLGIYPPTSSYWIDI